MDFLNNLEKKMNEKNLNKSQLARGMGVAPSTVNSWFNRSIDSLVYGEQKVNDFETFFMSALTSYLEEKRK